MAQKKALQRSASPYAASTEYKVQNCPTTEYCSTVNLQQMSSMLTLDISVKKSPESQGRGGKEKKITSLSRDPLK